ncbi:semaphorin-4G-like [Hemitrygon akajei]|uniref:semaphorin-4G-like n=1 Tax=Hemitrygon akajei TaxID=2704970 RepID=UPI003BF94B37
MPPPEILGVVGGDFSQRELACTIQTTAFCSPNSGSFNATALADMFSNSGIVLDHPSHRYVIDYKHFSHSVYNYTTFWLEEDQGVLYVGAREAIFALNMNDITDKSMKMIHWETPSEKRLDCLKKRGYKKVDCYNYIRFLQRFNATHLFTCGTNSFKPHCAYIEIEKFTLSDVHSGKNICPYNPTVGYTGVIIDNKIYAATLYEFHSGQANIKRFPEMRSFKMEDWFSNSPNGFCCSSLKVPEVSVPVPHTPSCAFISRKHSLLSRFVSDLEFVDSVLLRESVNSSVGDDDKIYFFFTEKLAREYEFNGKPEVSWVARICKSDKGGMKILQSKWTSFLKSRLICSIPEYGFHYNNLKSIYVLNQEHWQDAVFYGVFVSQWQNIETSAVCQYTSADIRKTFEGPYKKNRESPRWWSRYIHRVPEPRPGSCITDEFRKAGFMTSYDLPDDVLDFVKRHPLMDEEVRPVGGRPLFTKKQVNYTKIVVDTVTALDGEQYNVMFIGTDKGWIHKVVSSGASTHIVEEIRLYKDLQPVESLVLAKTQGTLFVGSQSGVTQLPVSNCHVYKNCWDCVLARDPYCGWDGCVCQDIRMQKNRTSLIQDIANGNKGCLDSNSNVINRRVPDGSDIYLRCDLSSNTATVQWEFCGSKILSGGGPHYWQVGTSLVVMKAHSPDSGVYICYAQENGISYAVTSYKVSVA